MKSSLPQIFKKDLTLLQLPQKQSSLFSLYLRTNAFKPRNTLIGQARYYEPLTHRTNKSMDNAFAQANSLNLDDPYQTKNSLKSLFGQRKSTGSKSMFIEQKQNQQIEQTDNFKTIRKRVLSELGLIKNSMQIVTKMEQTIKSELQNFRNSQIQQLSDFQTQMKIRIFSLSKTLKSLRWQTKTEIKVNREQISFLTEELLTYKQIYEGFQLKDKQIRFEILNQNETTTVKK